MFGRFGKNAALKLFVGIAIAASPAVIASPSASAHTTPAFSVQRPAFQDGYSSDVSQAIQASGFTGPTTPSASLLPGDTTFSWGAAAVGICIGAGLMLLLSGGGPRRPSV